MKTNSTKKKRPTTRAGRRGMSLAEWHRQNQWPPKFSEQRSVNREKIKAGKSTGELSSDHCSLFTDNSSSFRFGKIAGLHPEDADLITRLWDESGHRGIRFSTLASLYFPEAVTHHAAVARFSYELRCCHGLTEALDRLHHPRLSSRFTCAQVRQIFLFYGSPGE